MVRRRVAVIRGGDGWGRRGWGRGCSSPLFVVSVVVRRVRSTFHEIGLLVMGSV